MSETVKSEFLRVMQERGFIHQCTDLQGLDHELTKGGKHAYIGFDCTAPSLHVGNLVSIMMLRWLQKTGHQPIVLMGGGTSRIGDPSGKDSSRKMLSGESIRSNLKSISGTFERFLDYSDKTNNPITVNNDDWLNGLGYISFLRDIGPHFTINRMMTFDSVRLRLEREQPLTFLEFNYMILQAYDFLELGRKHDCMLQMGGSDQWGNIVNGIELTRRVDNRQVYGLTTPLITTADGKKMGKTESGAIWLNEGELPSYEYWQFWRNTQDADVGRFLRLFTDLPLDEIERLEALDGAEINESKIKLANAATAMCRGLGAADLAYKTATETFVKGGTGQDLPTVKMPLEKLEAGIGVLELFVSAGLAKSNGEARRLIQQGGAKLNDKKIDDITQIITHHHMTHAGHLKLAAGKKRFAVVIPE